MRIQTLLTRGVPALAAAWFLAATVLWTSSGAASTTNVLTTAVLLLVLGGGIWAWGISGRGLPPRGAMRLASDGVAAVAFACCMVLAGRSVHALTTPETLSLVLDQARLLPFEFALWMWMFALLIAAARGTRMSREVDLARRAEAEATAAATSARLDALQGQLNPHFLFNTLHGLAGLARRDPGATESALERLGDLLRYSLDSGDGPTVSLTREVEFTRDYLELATLARGDRLRIDFVSTTNGQDSAVPPFSLQTLVENAIKHGIDNRPQGGEVRVRVDIEGHSVVFEVSNPPGATESVPRGLGLGLENLASRVEVLYRGEASLNRTLAEDGTVTTVLRLPAP